jgi:hypothetical protein
VVTARVGREEGKYSKWLRLYYVILQIKCIKDSWVSFEEQLHVDCIIIGLKQWNKLILLQGGTIMYLWLQFRFQKCCNTSRREYTLKYNKEWPNRPLRSAIWWVKNIYSIFYFNFLFVLFLKF